MSGDSLSGDVALVTGATSGIGQASAVALAEAGANVALAARREERLDAVAADVTDHGRESLAVPTDVTDHAAVDALVERTVSEFGALDVVVVNAGIGIDGAVEELTVAEYRRMMAVNCDGAFFTARASIPHLRESSGNLVFVGSMAGEYPRPFNPTYAATKWWIRGLAHSLAGSFGEDGLAVSTVNPTEVRTEFGAESGESMAERFEPGEVTEPADVAEAIVFAASQDPPNAVHELDLYRRDKLSHF